MTNEVKVLTDDEVGSIAAKKYLHIGQRDVTVAMDEVRNDIDSLCATVRVLRVSLAQAEQAFELESAVRLPEVGNLNILQIVRKMAELHESNTALREQLVQRDQLLSDSNETEDRCRDLLAAYDQSSPEGVVSLDEVVRLVVGQLAQARQERDAALESLHDFTEAIARDNQRKRIQ